ncbi:MAG: hypothetical protein V4607_10210 [Pseudomonadota bacterium]
MTNKKRNTDGEIILFWALPFLILTWIVIFFLFPGFSPPMSPTMSAEQVAAFYRDPANLPRIRYSMIMFNWFGVGIVTFLVLIVMQIKRMAHRTSMLAYCYLGCSTGGPVLFFLADLFWLIAAFRPERDPQLTQMFNDLAWISFTGQVGFMVAQCVFLALAIFLDRQAEPIFQRWVAHFNLLIAAAIAPAAFVATSLTGPLAWDGLISFWIRNSALALWLIVMAIMVGKNIYKQRAVA